MDGWMDGSHRSQSVVHCLPLDAPVPSMDSLSLSHTPHLCLSLSLPVSLPLTFSQHPMHPLPTLALVTLVVTCYHKRDWSDTQCDWSDMLVPLVMGPQVSWLHSRSLWPTILHHSWGTSHCAHPSALPPTPACLCPFPTPCAPHIPFIGAMVPYVAHMAHILVLHVHVVGLHAHAAQHQAMTVSWHL